jgi:hypothetical protein
MACYGDSFYFLCFLPIPVSLTDGPIDSLSWTFGINIMQLEACPPGNSKTFLGGVILMHLMKGPEILCKN